MGADKRWAGHMASVTFVEDGVRYLNPHRGLKNTMKKLNEKLQEA